MGQGPRAETKTVRDKYQKEAEKILGSLLMDWQKLGVMRRFMRPKLEYILRMMLFNCSWAKNLDDVVWEMVKKVFWLLRRTITSFFYVLWKYGGLGLLSVGNGLDIRWASQVYKYLTSKDPKVMIICARHLKDTLVASKGVKNASFGDIVAFLNSQGKALQGRTLREY